MSEVGTPMKNLLNDINESRELLISLSEEFLEACNEQSISLEVKDELETIRRRAALRLVPTPKMGFEHLYFLRLRRGRED